MSNPNPNQRPFFTPEHEIFRQTVRSFVQKELLPHREEWENNKAVPKETFLKFAEQGFLGITMPTEYGGSACDYWYKVVFCEEMMGCRMNGFMMDVAVHTDMTMPIINMLGNEEQKKELLIPGIKGEKIFALGITEPDGGSDVAHVRTLARRVGDDYVINGAKTYITNGSRCDYILLAVRTGPAITKENFNEAHRGMSFILVPTKLADGSVRPGFTVGRKLVKMGNHSSDTAELSFQDMKVPARYLLGEENRGFYYIMQNFQGERLIAAIMAIAHCHQMIADAKKYATERKAFGQRLIDFQVWKHRLAQLYTEVAAGQELTYRACDLHARGVRAVKEITMAKLFTSELAQKVAYECLQIHGGAGYVEEYDISRATRDLRLLTIGAGTSEIMREILTKECEIG
ncbi:MAG: hypothetical protein ACD_73C00131G0002 [uncultured bacterium]|nr:MAG: hypothetical protein ACD_73C00131G0002 [uncultured bacterium]